MKNTSYCGGVILTFLIAGCATESKLQPCPTNGIAAAHLAKYPEADQTNGECSGGACIAGPYVPICDATDGCSQIRDYQQYACAEPQICPDVGGTDAIFIRTNQPTNVTLLITNCSTADRPLEVSGVQILGDTRCAFRDITDKHIGDRIILPGRTTAITTVYTPREDADDHAEIRILSNARNAPELHILACGTTRNATDSGASDARSAYGTPERDQGPKLDTRELLLNQRQCKRQTEVAPCHSRK